jgi:chemotaxis protein methyltransferase CheR
LAESVHPTELETRSLLEAIFARYHYDFRSYAMASLKRRVTQACAHLACDTVSRLQERVLHEPETFIELLQYLTIQVGDMYRNPEFFRAMRTEIVPILKTYPSLKIWVAGCSSGEEAYSLAILLQEEGILERAMLYATDINPRSLRTAESGIYELARMRRFTENHHRAGGHGALSDYYQAAGDSAVMDAALRKKITFSDHSLATDNVFSEVHLVSCRNVLIYFNRELQARALELFDEALCGRGFLGIGSKENLRFSAAAGDRFSEYCAVERIYRRVSLI